jgi:predicted AAA+ superfamily ATPase
MSHIPRILTMDLPPGQSAFLWGARKVGKSTFLQARYPRSVVYDFLDTELFLELSKRPALLREQLLARDEESLEAPVILDEVQKVPGVLDEVHWLIENKGLRFVLCGSSARKLRRGQANLLGGRAWRFEMLPLVSAEIGKLDLLRALNNGLIPTHYLQQNATRSLRAYTRDYLKEEVFAEGLARNIPAFSRFFDAMAYSHGELTNFANIARDCGVDAKTVREYYQVLVDTLLGGFVEPYFRRTNRQVITRAAKFYLFDVGVAGALTKRKLEEPRGEQFGRALEHLVLMELRAHASYTDGDYAIRFWRTKTGREVDFVLGDGEVAIEVKGTARADGRDLRGLRAFVDEHPPRQAILVCMEKTQRIVDGVRIMPWSLFLERLWADEIIR